MQLGETGCLAARSQARGMCSFYLADFFFSLNERLGLEPSFSSSDLGVLLPVIKSPRVCVPLAAEA